MEQSNNMHVEPMNHLRQALSLVTDRHVETPRMRLPGQIGGVLITGFRSSPPMIEDTRTGYDGDGSYHCALKTELNRWAETPDTPEAA